MQHASVPPQPDDLPRGCGWFESSHELQTGLEITEHDGTAAWAAHLPLSDWLAFQLAGWRAPRAA